MLTFAEMNALVGLESGIGASARARGGGEPALGGHVAEPFPACWPPLA